MASVGYNERSWAIDVISEINIFLSTTNWYLKSAGGENTISNEKSSLFPDVLIFGDNNKNIILQGWELKMPDTSVNDPILIRNAILKAEILKRDSFILWNVKTAVLYKKVNDNYIVFHTWLDININNRKDVKSNESLWKGLLHQILEDLNGFFELGELVKTPYRGIINIDTVIDIILDNTDSTAENLRKIVITNSIIDSGLNRWWTESAGEYGFEPNINIENKFIIYSKVILMDWLFKILFAHILKRYFNPAQSIENITSNFSIQEAKQIIEDISTSCDFWNIFGNHLAIEFIPESAWVQITQLNQFLTKYNLETLDITILQELLQQSISKARRKVAGQFSTPPKLAELLVRLTVSNKTGITLDPCCGTGTIVDQVYNIKKEYGINENSILDQVWASDKHSFPIQFTTVSLSKPENIGKVLNIFKSDVIDLSVGETIKFVDPDNGQIIDKTLPHFDYIVSNLPFIKEKEIKKLNQDIFQINEYIKSVSGLGKEINKRSDIFAYIPFYLHMLLKDDGKIGLVLSNSWLGTEFGEIFIELFQSFFDIEFVLISGKGRWFNNAEIVTTLLIATKRNPDIDLNTTRTISFSTINERLEEINDIKILSDSIILGNEGENVNIQKYTQNEILNIEQIGIPWSAYFTNLNWLPVISEKLINANRIFNFTRGERRGWNPLFYPKVNNNIEIEYLKPLIKDLRNTKGLFAQFNKEAFCCSKSIDELRENNHYGALNWIASFENQKNNSGKPLTESLKRSNIYWYEMKADNAAEFVSNINFHNSLFFAMCENPSFIDQRMIGLSFKESYKNEDKILYLALLNSLLSMFFIESFGFGRGLGALDLRESKFKKDFKILNPELLDEDQKNKIVEAFLPITQRDRLDLLNELEQPDRIHFEKVLLDSYGIGAYYEEIKNSLFDLFRIRFAVKE